MIENYINRDDPITFYGIYGDTGDPFKIEFLISTTAHLKPDNFKIEKWTVTLEMQFIDIKSNWIWNYDKVDATEGKTEKEAIEKFKKLLSEKSIKIFLKELFNVPKLFDTLEEAEKYGKIIKDSRLAIREITHLFKGDLDFLLV